MWNAVKIAKEILKKTPMTASFDISSMPSTLARVTKITKSDS